MLHWVQSLCVLAHDIWSESVWMFTCMDTLYFLSSLLPRVHHEHGYPMDFQSALQKIDNRLIIIIIMWRWNYANHISTWGPGFLHVWIVLLFWYLFVFFEFCCWNVRLECVFFLCCWTTVKEWLERLRRIFFFYIEWWMWACWKPKQWVRLGCVLACECGRKIFTHFQP